MPEYVAKKSAWSVVSFWNIILCLLIIPNFVLIEKILICRTEKIEFYDNKVVFEKGLLSKKQTNFAFTGVFSVTLNQSLWGRIFKYGDLTIDFVGRVDLNTKCIKNPEKLIDYLETKIVTKTDVHTYVN